MIDHDREPQENPPDHEGPVEVLLRITESARFLRLADGRLYAQVAVGGRQEIYALRSGGIPCWLIDGYHRDRRELPPTGPSAAWSGARGHRAVRGGTPSIFIRVGHDANGNGSTLLP